MSLLLTFDLTSGLVDLALKSAAVMLFTLVAATLLGRASSARRHLVWCLGVAGLLLLPALSLALPAWRVTWLPQLASVQAESAAMEQPALTQPNRSEPVDAGPTRVIVSQGPTVTAATIAGDAVPAAIIKQAGLPFTSLPWLALVWISGVLLSLIPLALGLWQLAALHRRSKVIDDQRWLARVNELRLQLAVRRSVQLRQTEAALAPLTWGALRPVLLVPAEASAWSDQRRQLVLLHELAHIRRWDWLTQLVAHVACALYWFNPLVWLAARQMRVERERACDDLVLASGARASDYAQELLAVAARLSASRLSTLVAVPMARHGALEDRLRGILDKSRNRSALTTASVCLGAMLAATTIAPLAMLRAAPPPKQTKPQEKSAKLADKPAPSDEKPAPVDPKVIPTAKKPGKATQPPADKPAGKKVDKPVEKPAAKSEAKTVTIRGKVLDDATGEPIERIIIQAGHFEPADPKKLTWGYSESRSSSRDGLFSTTVRWAEGWTARVLADGYIPHPVLTSAPPADKDEIEVTLRLKRGPKVRGVVLDHEGKPVKDAAVFAIGPTGVNLAGGQAWSSGGGNDADARPARTDEQGRFELPIGEATSLAVSHIKLDAWPATIPAKGDVTIRLPEPARVEIDMGIEGADKECVVFYQLLSHLDPALTGVRLEREVKVANPGKLSLAGLPPGKYQFCRQVMNRLPEFGTGAMLEREFFELKAGETKSIKYVREKGSRLKGKVTWPENTKLSGMIVSVQSETAEAGPFDKHKWTTSYASHTAATDGTFLTERIAPGKYLLVARAYTPIPEEQRFRTGAILPSHRAEMMIEVSNDGEITIPDLVLKPSKGDDPFR